MAVQISGNDITVPRDGSFTRNVTIGGTLTYEDVTNIDSVGLVTARNGIEIGARPGVAASISVDGNMIVSGISTFGGNVNLGDGTKLGIGGSPDVDLHIKSTAPTIRFTDTDTSRFSQIYAIDGNLRFDADNNNAQSDTTIIFRTDNTERLRIDSSGRIGIGDNSPDRELVVKHATSNSSIKIEAANDSTSQLFFSDTDAEGVARIAVFHGSGQSTSNSMLFETGGTQRLRIEPTGNVRLAQNLNVVGVCTAASFESATFSKTPTNTPAFHAWSNNVTSHPLSDSTITKVEFLNSETFDTDSAYDNSTSGTTANRFTVPTGKGGYYQISASLNFFANVNDMRQCRTIVKQNTDIKMTSYNLVTGSSDGDIRHFQAGVSGILQLAAGDYIELFGYLDTEGNSQGYISNDAQGYRGNHFSAYKLII